MAFKKQDLQLWDLRRQSRNQLILAKSAVRSFNFILGHKKKKNDEIFHAYK